MCACLCAWNVRAHVCSGGVQWEVAGWSQGRCIWMRAAELLMVWWSGVVGVVCHYQTLSSPTLTAFWCPSDQWWYKHTVSFIPYNNVLRNSQQLIYRIYAQCILICTHYNQLDSLLEFDRNKSNEKANNYLLIIIDSVYLQDWCQKMRTAFLLSYSNLYTKFCNLITLLH